MWYVIKTRQDKDMTNRNSAIYTENETELSWRIRSTAIYDENQIGQWRDQL